MQLEWWLVEINLLLMQMVDRFSSVLDDAIVGISPHHSLFIGEDQIALLSRKSRGWLSMKSSDWGPLERLLNNTRVGDLKDANAWVALQPVLRELYDVGLLSFDGETAALINDLDISSKPSTIMLKMTGACNISCSYCYDYDPDRWEAQVDVEIAKRLIAECLHPSRPLKILFHGGEPLLAFPKIRDIVDFAEQESHSSNAKVYFSIQTNGLTLDHEKIVFLEKHDFDVGISCDGPAHLHDLHRLDHTGRGTFDKLMAIIDKYPDFMLNKVGYISVPTHLTVQHLDEVWRFFQNLRVRTWKIVPLDLQGKAAMTTAQMETYQQYLVDFLDARLNEIVDNSLSSRPYIANILQLTESFISKHTSDICMKFPCGAGKELLVLDAQSNLRGCDSAYKDEFILAAGETLVQIKLSGDPMPLLSLREEWLTSTSSCGSCPWLQYCGGTCAARALLKHGTTRAIDELECETRLRLFPKVLGDVSTSASKLRIYSHRRSSRND